MLKLKNIKIDNGIISADYDPESSGNLGHIEVNIESKEVFVSKISQLDDPYFVQFGGIVMEFDYKELFSLASRCFDKLLAMHKIIEEQGCVQGTTHRYMIIAKK